MIHIYILCVCVCVCVCVLNFLAKFYEQKCFFYFDYIFGTLEDIGQPPLYACDSVVVL